MLASMLVLGMRHVSIDLGAWVEIPRHYHFSVKFVFDRLSVPMVILSFTLSGTIGAFASNYLHHDRGFNRFFFLYSVFVLGMVVTSLAGTIETMFAGWELVGLSSAMLVAYFQERPARAQRVVGLGRLPGLGRGPVARSGGHASPGWGGRLRYPARLRLLARRHSLLTAKQALVVGLLLVAAAAGKSALIPFSGWLPRTMEGPSPRARVFYGAVPCTWERSCCSGSARSSSARRSCRPW